MKIPHLFGTVLLAVSTLIATRVLEAAPVPMIDGISPQNTQAYFTGTVGYEFTTGPTSIVVTALGFVDGAADGLATSHQVGLWLPGNPTAIAQVTVPAGTAATLIGKYWYVNLATSVTLQPNTIYFLAAEVIQNGDPWHDLGPNPGFTSPDFNGFVYGGSGFSSAIFSTAPFGIPTSRGRGNGNLFIFDTANLLGQIPSAAVAPSITQEPQGGTRLVGDAITFTVQANGTPLNYRWFFGQTAVPNATNSSYSITNIQLANAGGYRVIITNTAGSATSMVATLTVTNPPVDITSGLRVWLKLDETTGLLATNTADTSNNGVLQGFVGDDSQWVTGRINGAIRVNPVPTSEEVVLVSDPGYLDFSTNKEFTLSAWVNGGPTQDGGAGILAKGTGNGGEQFSLDVAGGTYRFYGFAADGVAVAYLLTTTVAPKKTWQHIDAVESVPLNRVRLYVNGVQVASGAPLTTNFFQNNHEVSVGARQSSAFSSYDLNFNGRIDDVRIYGRPFTSADVQTLYNQASPVAPSIVQQPVGGEFYVCESPVLRVTADGTAPLSYQWQKNTVPIAGATNATFALNNIDTNAAGAYRVVVSNAANVATSSNAVVTVLPANQGRLFFDLNAIGGRNNFTGTVGTKFTTGGNALTVTALGYEDAGRDGLNGAHQVGLWDTNGTLLGSVSVPAGTNAPLQGAWRYVDLPTAITLPPATSFHIGAEVFSGDGDGWSDTGFSASPPFGFTCQGAPLMPAFAFGLLEFPNNDGQANLLRWSPGNARFTIVQRPALTITKSGNNATLSWPLSFTGFVLESTAVLPAITWAPVNGVVNNSVTLSIGSGARFFRLRQP